MKDSNEVFHGEIQLDKLIVKASATPRGEVRNEPDPITQVFFEPGRKVENVVIIGGGSPASGTAKEVRIACETPNNQ